jgi:tetratricopeptide (TPR) repeat protein
MCAINAFDQSSKLVKAVLCVILMLSTVSAASSKGVVPRKELLPLIQKSDVVAVVKIDCPGSLGGRQTAAPYVPITFKFEKILKASNWCKPPLQTQQTFLASGFSGSFIDGERYIVFLEKGTTDQWWDLDDNFQPLRFTEGNLIENARYTDLFDRPWDSVNLFLPDGNFSPLPLAEFEERLSHVDSPEPARHQLRTTDKKILEVVLEQRQLDASQNALSVSGSSELPLFIEHLSKIISICPDREPLMQRAWAYLYTRRYQEAITDLDRIIDHPAEHQPINKVCDTHNAGNVDSQYPDAKQYYLFWGYLSRALAELRLNKNSQAANDCTTAAGFCKSSGTSTLFGILQPARAVCAYCYWRMGNYQAAKRICDETIVRYRESYPGTYLYAIKAHVDMDLNDYSAALNDCNKVESAYKNQHKIAQEVDRSGMPSRFVYRFIREEPAFSWLLARAQAFRHLKRYSEARKDLDKVIDLQEKQLAASTECGIGITYDPEKDGHVRLWSVFPDTSAFLVGLAKGDEIIEVDGSKIRSMNEASQHLCGPKGTEVDVTVLRSNHPLKFRIKRDFDGGLGVYYEWRYDPKPLLDAAKKMRQEL